MIWDMGNKNSRQIWSKRRGKYSIKTGGFNRLGPDEFIKYISVGCGFPGFAWVSWALFWKVSPNPVGTSPTPTRRKINSVPCPSRTVKRNWKNGGGTGGTAESSWGVLCKFRGSLVNHVKIFFSSSIIPSAQVDMLSWENCFGHVQPVCGKFAQTAQELPKFKHPFPWPFASDSERVSSCPSSTFFEEGENPPISGKLKVESDCHDIFYTRCTGSQQKHSHIISMCHL